MRIDAVALGAAALVLGAYLLGSVSFGLLLARARGVDLRTVGSGNVGATNAGRALGRPFGRLVLTLDALKGAVPVSIAALCYGPAAWPTAAAGVAAVVGHLWPLWHGLRGGKGAATGLGVVLAARPVAGLLAAATYLVLSRATRRASVGSLGGALVGAAACAALDALDAGGALEWTGALLRDEPRPIPAPWPWARTVMAAVVLVLIFAAHAPNLRRLYRGEEPER
jgi:glycerol-3-phosphate acyltransferase PlsY